MAKGPYYEAELKDLEKYLRSNENEDAKRQLLFPLFRKMYKDKMHTESAAGSADVYIEGLLVVESKTDWSQWVEGLYQALHYHRRYGLAFNAVMVVAHQFCAIWKVKKLPDAVITYWKTAAPLHAPNEVGRQHARKTTNALKILIKESADYWLYPKDLDKTIWEGGKSLFTETFQIKNVLQNLDADRYQINTHNFIQVIERMKKFFEHPIDAIHAFYAMIPHWDITATAAVNETTEEVRVIGHSGNTFSDNIKLQKRHLPEFKRFVETQYLFTNDGSGITVDYYFGRFDEVLAAVDPEYVRQHGIFFTNADLSRYALWFAKHHFPGNINEDYVVFDPAGGSGNLVSSWRGKLKHKIVSELQPDLLRIVERRMQADPFHLEMGFTIIPRTSSGEGLNFLDRPAAEYMHALMPELRAKNIALDKPLAFLLNPPYKNTDENEAVRGDKGAAYTLDPAILELTGADAGNERYLAFLGQILNICKWQTEAQPGIKPVVMIFTPTSWLLPRPTYAAFRQIWDAHFRYQSGFIVTSNEFFKLDGKWPLAFTMWEWEPNAERSNSVEVYDLTALRKSDLDISWGLDDAFLEETVGMFTEGVTPVKLDNARGNVKAWVGQSRFDFIRDPTKEELQSSLYGGLPLKDPRRKNKKTYGIVDGTFIGFMDDTTPVRIKQDRAGRVSQKPDRVWFRLDRSFIDVNISKCFNAPPDQKAFCAFDMVSAKTTFTWFTITKIINGQYPLWANQYDLWPPNIPQDLADEWYALCFALVLAENRCIVTKFEADNPVPGAPEVFVDNPLSPNNPQSFWRTTLAPHIMPGPARLLADAITALYRHWNTAHAKGGFLYHQGLEDEPYFKYFSYPDFLTPNSGLIQLRKWADLHGAVDMQQHFTEVSAALKKVRERLWEMLVVDMGYFS